MNERYFATHEAAMAFFAAMVEQGYFCGCTYEPNDSWKVTTSVFPIK